VVYIPPCLVSDVLSATRAAFTLTPPQCRHGFHLLQFSGPDQNQTPLEVDFHAGRIRGCVGPDRDVAFDGRIHRPGEIECFTLRSRCAEQPAPVTEREILICNPTPAFTSMPPFTPLPYCPPDMGIDIMKAIFGHDMPMIVSPSTDDGVEQVNQFPCRKCRITLN